MSHEILVIIDPQQDFIHPGGNYAEKHTAITQISVAKESIIGLVQRVGIPVIIVYSDYKPGQFEDQLPLCIPGTEGHKIDIPVSSGSILFAKTEHSAFSSSAFIAYLKTHDIKHFYLAGFLAEYCVKQTALDALKENFKVSLLEDCIGTGDDVQERKQQAIDELIREGALLINSGDIAEM